MKFFLAKVYLLLKDNHIIFFYHPGNIDATSKAYFQNIRAEYKAEFTPFLIAIKAVMVTWIITMVF